MKPSEIVEYAALLIMLVGLVGVFHNRLRGIKNDKPYTRGIGARVIQLVAVILVVPAILILGLAKVLSGETVATLFGTLIGYLLSGIGNFRTKSPGDVMDD